MATKASTIDRFKKGERIKLYSRYSATWDANKNVFRIFLTRESGEDRLVGIIPARKDDCNNIIIDWSRLDTTAKDIKDCATRFINAILNDNAGFDVPKHADLVAIPKSKLNDLIGMTIYGAEIQGILTEVMPDGATTIWFRTNKGIKTAKQTFNTEHFVIKEV